MTQQAIATADDLENAKAAITRKDWDTARRLLEPLVAQNASGTAAFFMARIELEQDHLDAALLHLDAFQKKRPNHAGAKLLRARLALANGAFDDAETHARAALDHNPNMSRAHKLLEQIDALRHAATAKVHLAVIDAEYLEARDTGPSDAMRAAAAALAELPPGPDWNNDPLQASIAYFRFAPDLDNALRNYDPHLIEVSTRFDYITWPKRIQDHVTGKSVIDVGCGFGGYGMGFLIAGAKDYAGLDPVMKLDSTRAKNKRIRKWADMGVTPREVAAALPAIRLFECIAEDMPVQETFDTIALHNVTEHLIQLDLVFEGLVGLCNPDTRIIYLHHNYYCWNGHHFAPNQPHQLDETNPEQQQVYDWRHIDMIPTLPEDHYFSTHLNRVRLDEIRRITEKHFDIETWDEIPSSQATLNRLTPEVFARVQKTLPDITQRELETNVVFCVAKPKIASGGEGTPD